MAVLKNRSKKSPEVRKTNRTFLQNAFVTNFSSHSEGSLTTSRKKFPSNP